MAIKQSSAVFFLISFLCFAASTHARSVSVFGDVHIDISEDKFRCDKIDCPLNAERCSVSKRKDPNDSSVMVRTNICYSATNEVLQKSVTNEQVDPNSKINVQIEASRSGSISSFNSYDSGDFNEEEFKEQFNSQMNQFQENLNEEMDNLNKELSQLSYTLGNMFN